MHGQPTLSKATLRGVDLAWWQWPCEGPSIVLCHATGFHGRCWDQVVRQLPGRRVIAVDFRGHGRSGNAQDYSWRRFGEDLAELMAHIGVENAVGVGHSMGGHAVALAAALNPAAFRSLILLDPVILPPEQYRGPEPPLDFVLRRRNQWTSPDEMVERFRSRPPFNRWAEGVLRDYCDYALNGAQLACQPEVEAFVYAHSCDFDANIYAELAAVSQPVVVVRSRDPYSYGKFDGSATAPDLAARFPHGQDLHWTNVSHFIPMEAPTATAKLILKT